MKAVILVLLVSGVVGCGSDFTSESGSSGGTGGSSEGGEAGQADVGGAAGSAGESGEPGDAGSAGSAGLSQGGAESGGSGGLGVAGAVALGGSGGSGGLTASAGAGGGSPIPSVKAFDDFVGSAEGWTITGDDVTKVPKYSSTGGNPNGQINATDGSTGVFFFTAPKKYVGNLSTYYGGELRFDLKISVVATYFEYADVELTGTNGVTLAYNYPTNPTTAWKKFVVPLSESGWKVSTITGAAATAAQFQTVLKELARLRIRGEFIDGNDTGYLDNVFLGGKGAQVPPAQ